MSLNTKEKELISIGASVASGCKPCTSFHFKEVRKTSASDDEIRRRSRTRSRSATGPARSWSATDCGCWD